MDVSLRMWGAFCLAIVAFLGLDLVVLGRSGGRPSFRQAAIWSVWWTGLGVAFGGLLWISNGSVPAGEYLAGAKLLDAVHWSLYLFGVFLVVTGVRMAMHTEPNVDPERSVALRALRHLTPVTSKYRGTKLFVRIDGSRTATPMLVALVLVATFDVAFAVDSIPALFAITRDTFIVFAANAFSLLGLASLFFLLAGLIERFVYLKYGLAAILVLVGAKMLLSDIYEIPIWASLSGVLAALAVSAFVSMQRTRSQVDDAALRARADA